MPPLILKRKRDWRGAGRRDAFAQLTLSQLVRGSFGSSDERRRTSSARSPTDSSPTFSRPHPPQATAFNAIATCRLGERPCDKIPSVVPRVFRGYSTLRSLTPLRAKGAFCRSGRVSSCSLRALSSYCRPHQDEGLALPHQPADPSKVVSTKVEMWLFRQQLDGSSPAFLVDRGGSPCSIIIPFTN